MAQRENYEPGEFCWVDLNSHDMHDAKQFYADLFGWQSIDFDTQGGPPYVGFMNSGRNIAGLGEMSAEMKAQGIPPTWNCYVRVEDCASAEALACKLGAQVIAPTMQVFDAGRLAFLADPTGAVFALWEPRQHRGAQAWGDDKTPCWCELATREIEGARAFYEGLFGWRCNEFPGTPSKYYVANVGEAMTGGLLQMTKEWGEMPAHWSVYFHVADVDATVARCNQLGGKICFPPFDAGVGRIAGCNDRQGAFFYLIKLNPTGAAP